MTNITYIPLFMGFYENSLHSRILEKTIQQMCSEYVNAYPELIEEIQKQVNYSKLREAYVKQYTKAFANMCKLEWEFITYIPPKYCEPTVHDYILVSFSDEMLRVIWNKTDKTILKNLIQGEYMYTDGYEANYSCVLEDWGICTEWDSQQLSNLLLAYLISQKYYNPNNSNIEEDAATALADSFIIQDDTWNALTPKGRKIFEVMEFLQEFPKKEVSPSTVGGLVSAAMELWIKDGRGDECLWESWPQCPSPEHKVTPNMVMTALNERK